MAPGARLAIDFGTSNTVALLQPIDSASRPLLIDGSPLLPSAVYLEHPGDVLSGADALRSARLQPERFEPNPKRRMADGLVLLGGHEVDVVDLVAAVLARVGFEARRALGQYPDVVVATHPEEWGTARLKRLATAVTRAGLPTPRLVSEPVAAAAYFLDPSGPVAGGRCVVIYDFGAGTFDASVVRRDADGALTVLASEGLAELGGLDLDAALVEHLGTVIAARDRAAWDRLSRPERTADRRARWQLWEDVRLAKEALSRRAHTFVHVPSIDSDIPLTRQELEELAQPHIARTVAATRSAVRSAGVAPEDIGGIFLVGGSSQVPLVATELHRAFGVAPAMLEQAQLVVAEGALKLLDTREIRTPVGVTIALPVSAPPRTAATGTAPVVPAPVTPAPVTPAPVTPAPVTPAPVTPAPIEARPAAAPANPPLPSFPQVSATRERPRERGGQRDRQPERPARRSGAADPWGIVAALVLGVAGAAVMASAGVGAGTAIAVGVGIAVTVYLVRVLLGALLDR